MIVYSITEGFKPIIMSTYIAHKPYNIIAAHLHCDGNILLHSRH